MSRAIAIVGPTAAGKTVLSLALAERVQGEVISMDSRQVYRGMDIGTAKATPAERVRVPHHGLDLVDPDERFSAAAFARMARGAIRAIEARGHTPLLVGGTGFFLRALTHPLFREPPLDAPRRAALAQWLNAQPEAELLRWLRALDPAAGERLRAGGGRQRLLRALELPLLTGRPLSWLQAHSPPGDAPLRPLIFVLEPGRDALRAAIAARVARMAEAGLVDEARGLVAAGYRAGDPGMNATGYAELLPVLAGETTLADALERVRANTWAYARRQMTWFRHQLPPEAVRLDAGRPLDHLSDHVTSLWRRESPNETGAA